MTPVILKSQKTPVILRIQDDSRLNKKPGVHRDYREPRDPGSLHVSLEDPCDSRDPPEPGSLGAFRDPQEPRDSGTRGFYRYPQQPADTVNLKEPGDPRDHQEPGDPRDPQEPGDYHTWIKHDLGEQSSQHI